MEHQVGNSGQIAKKVQVSLCNDGKSRYVRDVRSSPAEEGVPAIHEAVAGAPEEIASRNTVRVRSHEDHSWEAQSRSAQEETVGVALRTTDHVELLAVEVQCAFGAGQFHWILANSVVVVDRLQAEEGLACQDGEDKHMESLEEVEGELPCAQQGHLQRDPKPEQQQNLGEAVA